MLKFWNKLKTRPKPVKILPPKKLTFEQQMTRCEKLIKALVKKREKGSKND